MFSLAHVIANYVIVLQLDDGLSKRICVPRGNRSKLAHKLHAARNVRPNKAAAISPQTTRDLVHEFNLKELRVRLVKLSDSHIEKLTHTHSGDKSTSSLVSQYVDQQQATSSDGKQTFLLNKYIYANLGNFNPFFFIFFYLFPPHFASQN
jgi:hypothetical protein